MIVVLGGTGYVGHEICHVLRSRGYEHWVASRAHVNYTDPQVLQELLQRRRPDFVINAAGYTGRPNVDACESAKTECLAGNAVLPGIIRRACEAAGIPWGHVSSGCIYTGSPAHGRGFREDDPPNFTFRQNNCSFYAGSKALGEELLQGASQCYVWRLRMPFGHLDSPRNHLSKVLRYERLLDVRNSLSDLHEAAEACVDCWARRVPFGTYHLTNPGSVTTREVTEMLIRSSVTAKRFEFFESEEEFLRTAAATPRSHCVLDSGKAVEAGLKLTPVEEALRRAIDKMAGAA